jgi:hypothetical protein
VLSEVMSNSIQEIKAEAVGAITCGKYAEAAEVKKFSTYYLLRFLSSCSLF